LGTKTSGFSRLVHSLARARSAVAAACPIIILIPSKKQISPPRAGIHPAAARQPCAGQIQAITKFHFGHPH
jgi:hypothetical protein